MSRGLGYCDKVCLDFRKKKSRASLCKGKKSCCQCVSVLWGTSCSWFSVFNLYTVSFILTSLSVVERLPWCAAVFLSTCFPLSPVHPPLYLIVADLPLPDLWLTGVKSGLASAAVTVVKETESPVPLPWGNRTASCGPRCCRTSERIQSSPITNCRSGTRYVTTNYKTEIYQVLSLSVTNLCYIIYSSICPPGADNISVI